LGDLGVDGKIIVKCILNEKGIGGMEYTGSGQGPVMGSCEHGNEPFGSIEDKDFLD
jgi:hypothetical protein